MIMHFTSVESEGYEYLEEVFKGDLFPLEFERIIPYTLLFIIKADNWLSKWAEFQKHAYLSTHFVGVFRFCVGQPECNQKQIWFKKCANFWYF